MLNDDRGLAVTTVSGPALELMERATRAFVAQHPDARSLLQQALAADPGLTIGHVLDGFCHLLAARRPAVSAACSALARVTASIATRGGTQRECRLADALAAWARQGDMLLAADLLDANVQFCGLDLLSLRLGHAVRFMLGDVVGMRRALEAALPAWPRGAPPYGYVLGCYAFALGETGDLSRAEAVGRKAVALCADDLWGGHAVAHAMAGQRRPREAVAWIASMEPHMQTGAIFVRHLHWHRALGHLALGERERAMEVYSTLLRPAGALEVRDMLNLASLLWRLEDAGMPVERRMWDDLADIAEARTDEHAWIFADLHYALCLAGGGRREALSRLLGTMWHYASTAHDTQSRVAAEIGLPVAHAIASLTGGSPARAAELLRAATPDLHRLGGSHAQRDLIKRLYSRSEVAAGLCAATGGRHVSSQAAAYTAA